MFPIPANATRIRYLESTGTQYVDTGVPTVTPFVVEVKFSISPDGATNDSLFGTFLSNNRLWLLLTKLANGKNRISIRCTNPQMSVSTKIVDLLDNQVATIKARFGAGGWFELNGGSRVTYTGSDVSLPNNNLYLLGRNGNNFPIGARLYRASISDADGTITRDFTPIRIGQTGYLFDRVSGQLFGNAGTGAFVLGPDTFASGVVPTRMMVAGVRTKEVWPTPLYTGVSIVGSSVQNNNGILSGFTSSSYATMPFYWTAGASQIEAVIKIHFAQTGSAQGIWGCVGSTNAFTPFYYLGNNGPLGSYLSISGAAGWNATPDGASGSKKVYWQNTNPASAGDYILRETFSSGSVATSHWSGAWSQDSSNAFTAVHGAANLVPQLGTNRGSNNPFLGTIDLNYTYLMRDGELWWEGAPGAYKNVKTTYPD